MSVEPATGLTFTESGLAHALTQHALAVPLNQRAYAWGEPEVETLLTDLYRSFSDGESIYFLGAVLLTRGPHGVWQVADGQQRLATASIVVAAVRDYLLELGDTAGADKYQSTYLLDYDVRKKTSAPKLNLNFEDHEYFFETILQRPQDRKPYGGRAFPSHDRLKAAADLAHQHVRTITAGFPVAERAERLYDWIDFLDKSAKVIVIMVPGRVGNAFKMFETMNGRGVEASQLDILKNFLFEKAQNKMGEVHTRWISMVSTIEDLGMDDLLLKYIRHFWISQHGPTTDAELGERIEKHVRTERQAVDLIAGMDSSATDYVALLSARSHHRWAEFNQDTRNCVHTTTRELQAVQIRPLLLAILRHFTVKEAAKAFELCLSWTVRFLIAGGGGGGVLDRHFGRRAMEISTKEIATTKKMAERMADLVPNDEVFRRAFAIASVRQAHLARYYLRAIDLYLKEERRPQFVPNEDTLAVNLEHVLPVTPSAKWKVSQDEAAAYYKRLGNLALIGTTDNVKLSNGTFDEKRIIYKASSFTLTKELGKYRTWGPEQIEHQQERMAGFAPRVWPI